VIDVRKGTCVLIQKWALPFLVNQDTIKTKEIQFGVKNVQRAKVAIHQMQLLALALLEATLTSVTWSVMSAQIDISARRKMLPLLFHVLLALTVADQEKRNA